MIIRETDLLAPDASDPDSVENATAAGAPTWPYLLRTLHLSEWNEQIPSALKFERAIRTVQKHGALMSGDYNRRIKSHAILI